MILRRRGADVLVWAPAKVNLFLEVLGSRPDGYHELATLMVAVSLYDTLEFAEDSIRATLRLRCDQPASSDRAGKPGVSCRRTCCGSGPAATGAGIRLWKRIPLAAGLAGGSSDAAATLAGLNKLWRLGWERADWPALGAEMGSDVAFFFATPAAWCTGRGEIVKPCRWAGRSISCWPARRWDFRRPRSIAT